MLNLSREQRDDFLFDVAAHGYREHEDVERIVYEDGSRDLDVKVSFYRNVDPFRGGNLRA